MEKVIGIRFREGCKIYHFDPGDHLLKRGDHVIVNTEQGVQIQARLPSCPAEGAPAEDSLHLP